MKRGQEFTDYINASFIDVSIYYYNIILLDVYYKSIMYCQSQMQSSVYYKSGMHCKTSVHLLKAM